MLHSIQGRMQEFVEWGGGGGEAQSAIAMLNFLIWDLLDLFDMSHYIQGSTFMILCLA